MDDDAVLDAVGPRLRGLRQQQQLTLADVSAGTGISISTLSRLEAGQRRPTLELLLPLARVFHLPLDELVGAPQTGDPRVRLQPLQRNGRTLIPLTRQPGGLQSYKMIVPPGEPEGELRVHEGHEWMYVLSGRLRLRLGELDLVLTTGEVAEFDTHTPHWFGAAGSRPVELLTLFGPQGERMHVRARTKAG
jgi:transcriptional regulator with XRE-family HTH domain